MPKQSCRWKRYIYTKQRNLCISLLRKEIKNNTLQQTYEKDITDNRKFWHTVKPFFSENIKSREIIVLIEKGKTISKEGEVGKVLY